jgi:hypothetical protein
MTIHITLNRRHLSTSIFPLPNPRMCICTHAHTYHASRTHTRTMPHARTHVPCLTHALTYHASRTHSRTMPHKVSTYHQQPAAKAQPLATKPTPGPGTTTTSKSTPGPGLEPKTTPGPPIDLSERTPLAIPLADRLLTSSNSVGTTQQQQQQQQQAPSSTVQKRAQTGTNRQSADDMLTTGAVKTTATAKIRPPPNDEMITANTMKPVPAKIRPSSASVVALSSNTTAHTHDTDESTATTNATAPQKNPAKPRPATAMVKSTVKSKGVSTPEKTGGAVAPASPQRGNFSSIGANQGSVGGEGADEYEILCAELLQWSYANARLESAFSTRSKKATDVLVALCEANREQVHLIIVCVHVCAYIHVSE